MRTAEAARDDGKTVDVTCYPWYAYKGPRFVGRHENEGEYVLTDLEAELLAMLREVYPMLYGMLLERWGHPDDWPEGAATCHKVYALIEKVEAK